MPVADGPHHRLRGFATFVGRVAGLLATTWLAAGFLAGAYVGAERRWPIGVVDFLILPWWAALVWCWPATRRLRWFLVASLTASLVMAIQFGARFYEVDPDLGRTGAKQSGFTSALVAGALASAVAFMIVWTLRWRRKR